MKSAIAAIVAANLHLPQNDQLPADVKSLHGAYLFPFMIV